MKISSGIYNNHGYVQIRIWPWSKTEKPNPYTERGFGCWCATHIKQAEFRLRALRGLVESGRFAKQQELVEWAFPQACDYFFQAHYVEKRRTKRSITNARSYIKKFKELWPSHWISQITPKLIKTDWLDKTTLKGSSLRRQMGFLETVFDELERLGKLRIIDPPVKLPDFNPVTPFEKPSGKFTGKKHLSQDELQRFKNWALANDPDLWVAAYYAMTTLLRHGDLDAQAGGSVYGEAAKTGKGFVLTGQIPRTAAIRDFANRWEKARKECSIVWFHWHWWRAQGAKVMREQGVPEDTVKELLQHSNVRETRLYTGDATWAQEAVDKTKNYLDTL